jgi:ABC-type transport system involved in multi-copper enzyme maturation permease subunit
MRSGLIAGLMGIGGIFLSFGAVIVVLAIFTRQSEWRLQLPTMTTVGVGSIVIGAVMFGAGFLLSRIGRGSDDSSGAAFNRT